jgi:hypothetical protein
MAAEDDEREGQEDQQVLVAEVDVDQMQGEEQQRHQVQQPLARRQGKPALGPAVAADDHGPQRHGPQGRERGDQQA